jgi:hypothetical protein
MNKLKTIITIALLLALLPVFGEGTPPNNIPITGEWDTELPGHFMADTVLEPDSEYSIRNNTGGTIYVWLMDAQTPLAYFPLVAGETRKFVSPGDGFDLYSVTKLKGVSLRQDNDNYNE